MDRCGIGGQVEGGRLMGDEEAALLELPEEAACDQRVPTLAEAAVDLSEEDAVAAVDEAARVAV
jgi:hypothetical protein